VADLNVSESLMAYLADLGEIWKTEGRDALLRCARDEPGVFCRLVGSLLPRDVQLDIDVNVDIRATIEAFRSHGMSDKTIEGVVSRLMTFDASHDAG
jgi:hypothetical protein